MLAYYSGNPDQAMPFQANASRHTSSPARPQALTGCIIWRCWNKTPRLDSLRTVWMAAKCAMMSIMEHVSRDTHSTPIISPLLSDLFFCRSLILMVAVFRSL